MSVWSVGGGFWQEVGGDDFFPDGVPFWVHVEVVGDEDVGEREAVGAEHFWEDIDEIEVGALLSPRLDGGVDGFELFDHGPAFWVGGVGDVGNFRFGKVGMDSVEQSGEGFENVVGGCAAADVIGTHVDDDLARLMGFDEDVVVFEGFFGGGASEAAVDNAQAGEIGGQGFPESDAGASGEDDAAVGAGVFGIGFAKSGELGGVFGWRGGSAWSACRVLSEASGRERRDESQAEGEKKRGEWGGTHGGILEIRTGVLGSSTTKKRRLSGGEAP